MNITIYSCRISGRAFIAHAPGADDDQRYQAGASQQEVRNHIRRRLGHRSAARGRDGLAAGPGQITQPERQSLVESAPVRALAH